MESAKEEKESQLTGYGLKTKRNFELYNFVLEDLEPLLYKTMFNKQKYHFACARTFGYTDIIRNDVYLCCPDMLPESAGNINQTDFLDIWNSGKAGILRLSILNGTYSFCNLQYCLERIELRDEVCTVKSNYENEALEYPDTMVLAIDETCNLSCPSCRDKAIIYSQEKITNQQKITESLMEKVIPHVKNLWLAGCGEVFFSK